MTVLWDPEQLLGIRGRSTYGTAGIQCHGANQGTGPRCRWTKGGRPEEMADVRQAGAYLRTMAAKPPSSVTAQEFRDLARVCLCRDHHMNQSQVEKVVRGWAPIIQRAVAAYTPAPVAPVRSTLPPLKAPVLTPAPFMAPAFDTTSWQNTNWQATLASQVAAGVGVANISTQSSQSTANGAQYQHADAPSDFTARNAAPVITPEQELAAVQEQLATLRLENTQLREKESRLDTLVKENSTTRLHKEIELASTQKELSTLQSENSRLLQEQQRLEKLDSDLAITREKVTALQSQADTLVSSQEDLEILKSKYSQFLSESKVELEAVKAELSQADAEKAHLKESLTRELATLKESLTLGLITLQEEHDAALARRDLNLQTLRDKHTALQSTHATAEATLRKKDATLQERDAALQERDLALAHKDLDLQTLRDRHTALQSTHATADATLQERNDALHRQEGTLRQRAEQLRQRDGEVQHLRAENGRLLYTLRIAEMRSMSMPQPAYVGGRGKAGGGKGLIKRVKGWVKKLGARV